MHSYSWVRTSHGGLSPAEKRKLRAIVLRSYGRFAIGLLSLLWRRPSGGEGAPVAPDSRLCRLAEEAAREQSDALLGHAYRTWRFGGALATRDGALLDPELFYVASLLHDSGLLKSVAGEDFTLRSADRARDACARAGDAGDDAKAAAIADAIVAHATPGVSVESHPLGHYVQAGALLDLADFRLWDVSKAFVQNVYETHPRHDVFRIVPGLIRAEAAAVPEGRFALLAGLGFPLAIRWSLTQF